LVHFFLSIGPAALSFPGRRELFISAFPQMRPSDAFVVGSNPDGKPWVASTILSGFWLVAFSLKKFLSDHGTPVLGF
jgi:hypothetical protein